jgi:CXXC-20-CXXC protein
MKCPKCDTKYSYWESWKIWNPRKYVCPYCSAVLKAGPKGIRLIILSVGVGVLIAVVAIIMEEKGMWRPADSMKFFAIVLPVVAIPWSYVCWKLGDLVEINR